MVDRLTPQRRSWLMSRVRGKNTSPELRVRKVARELGLKFSLHPKTLPGKPDLAFRDRKFALFVHGCYWHRHPGCPKATRPSSPFWRLKFKTNVSRDVRVTKALKKLGWRVGVIWECESKNPIKIAKKLRRMVVVRRRKKNARTKARALRIPKS